MDAISPVAATNQVTQWLSAFGAALERRDVSAAAKMFAEECYWRDLVGFTWNITTLRRPRRQIRGDAGGHAGPREAVAIALVEGEERREADGVTEGWITFETAVGARLWPRAAEGRAMLDTADHDDRAEGLRGAEGLRAGRRASSTAAIENRRTWRKSASRRQAELGYSPAALCRDRRRRPGRHRARRAAEAARRADASSSRRTSGRATPGASATSRSACTTRSGTTICPTCPSPTTGRSSRPRTRSATGWRCTPRSWSSTTGARPKCKSASLRRGEARNGRSWSSATARTIVLRPKQLVLATGMSGNAERAALPGHGEVQGRAAPLQPASRAARAIAARRRS